MEPKKIKERKIEKDFSIFDLQSDLENERGSFGNIIKPNKS